MITKEGIKKVNIFIGAAFVLYVACAALSGAQRNKNSKERDGE